MRISLDTLWSGLGVLAGSSLLNTNVLNVKLRGNFPSTTDQIKFQFWRAFEFTLDFQQRNFLHYIAGDAALWNPGKYIPKVMLRVVGEEGSPLRGWRRRKWKLFFRKFSESDWHLSISSPMMRRGSGGGRKARSVCGKIWREGCEPHIVRLWECEEKMSVLQVSGEPPPLIQSGSWYECLALYLAYISPSQRGSNEPQL